MELKNSYIYILHEESIKGVDDNIVMDWIIIANQKERYRI